MSIDHALTYTTEKLSLEAASRIVDFALEAGRQHPMMPLALVCLDDSGQIKAIKVEDRFGHMRVQVALAKTWGALGMGTSRRIGRLLSDRPTFVSALISVSGGRFTSVLGGVIILVANGRDRLGAVGISGDTSDKDEYEAIRGMHAVGLRADPAEPAPNWQDSTLGPEESPGDK